MFKKPLDQHSDAVYLPFFLLLFFFTWLVFYMVFAIFYLFVFYLFFFNFLPINVTLFNLIFVQNRTFHNNLLY